MIERLESINRNLPENPPRYELLISGLFGNFNYRNELIRLFLSQPNRETFEELEASSEAIEVFLDVLKGEYGYEKGFVEAGIKCFDAGVVNTASEVYMRKVPWIDRKREPEGAIEIPLVGIVGDMASGKGTAGDILQTAFGFVNFPLSERLREVANGRGQFPPHSRNLLGPLGFELEEKFGNDVIARWTLKTVARRKKRHDIDERSLPGALPANEVFPGASIDGFRRIENAHLFMQEPQTLLIAVTADFGVRFKRAKLRGRLGEELTEEKFLEIDRREGVAVAPIIEVADVVIENNIQDPTQEEFKVKLITAVSQYFGISPRNIT